MSKLVFNRDGGKTDEFGHLLGLARSMQGEVIEGLLVAANGSPNMTVNVPIGTAMIPVGSGGAAYKYFVGLDATESVAITTANPSNPRNDLIVMYVDVAVTPSQSFTNNSNNMLKLVAVAGTPAASPADPSVANIQTAIGAANPYIILARVGVGAGVTQINSGNITDLRAICVPRRVDSTSFVDNTLSGIKLLGSSVAFSKIDTTTFPKFRAYRSTTNQTIGTGDTKVAFNTTEFGTFDTTNSRFVCTVAGTYRISALVESLQSNAGSVDDALLVYKNGTFRSLLANIKNVQYPGLGGSDILQLAVGDYIEIYYRANLAGANLQQGLGTMWFNGHLLP